jgi:hypothetical protein
MRFCSMICLCTHSLKFNQCYTVHAVKRARKKFPIQTFALFTIVVHSEFPSTLAVVHPARILMSLSILCTCFTTVPASGYLFVNAWHWEFSDASVCVKYFRNPSTGTSAILVYTQVQRKVKSVKLVSFKLLNQIKTLCSWSEYNQSLSLYIWS